MVMMMMDGCGVGGGSAGPDGLQQAGGPGGAKRVAGGRQGAGRDLRQHRRPGHGAAQGHRRMVQPEPRGRRRQAHSGVRRARPRAGRGRGGAPAGLRRFVRPVATAAEGGVQGRGIRGERETRRQGGRGRRPDWLAGWLADQLPGWLALWWWCCCQDEHKERLLVSYRTSEGWKCTAELHRFHVISAGRHRSILDEYQARPPTTHPLAGRQAGGGPWGSD